MVENQQRHSGQLLPTQHDREHSGSHWSLVLIIIGRRERKTTHRWCSKKIHRINVILGALQHCWHCWRVPGIHISTTRKHTKFFVRKTLQTLFSAFSCIWLLSKIFCYKILVFCRIFLRTKLVCLTAFDQIFVEQDKQTTPWTASLCNPQLLGMSRPVVYTTYYIIFVLHL